MAKPRPDYTSYIASPEWQTARRRYFASGLPRTCQGLRAGVLCGDKRVDLHHWTYERLGHESPSDLIPLCRECHDRVHELAESCAPGPLKRATKAVCGSDILKRQNDGWQSFREERKAAQAARSMADEEKWAARRARRKERDRLLRADLPPPKPDKTLLPTLRRQLEAFGAACRYGQDGKAFRQRAVSLALVAKRAGRPDIARAVLAYAPKARTKRKAPSPSQRLRKMDKRERRRINRVVEDYQRREEKRKARA